MNHKTAFIVLIFTSLLFLRGVTYQENSAATILISEIVYDTWRDDALNEWVELLVVSEAALEAGQIKLGDEEEVGGGEGMMRFPKETVFEPGEIVVVAQSAVDFWNVYGVYPSFEMIDSTPDVPNMIRVSLLAKGDIAFSNSGDEVIVLNDKNRPLDRISYGDQATFLNPPIEAVEAGWSLERIPPNCDTDRATDFRAQKVPTPFKTPEFGVCSTTKTSAKETANEPLSTETTPLTVEAEQFTGDAISQIQGNRATAAQVDQAVRFQGIVTALTADKNASGTTFYTLFVQDSGDGNLETSDAMPVFTGRKPPSVQVGDLVEISGTVIEYFGLTEIADTGLHIQRIAGNYQLPPPIELNSDTEIGEHFEGMRLSLAEAIVAGPVFDTASGCGFSVVPLGSDPLPIIRHSLSDDVSKIIPILPNDDRDCAELPPLKRGDRVFDLVGPLTWNFEEWKIIQQPDVPIRFEVGDPLPLPEKVRLADGEFSIATLNLENHFDSIDDTGDDSEPKPAAETIAVRDQKFAHLIAEWMGCPTLIGIQEVEKESLLLGLAAAVEPLCGFQYGVAHLESYDGRGIDNALLFDPRRVKLNGLQLRQTCTEIDTAIDPQGFSCPAGKQPLFSRPPLEAKLLVDDQPLIIFVNHFKSKLGGELETAPRRLAQAAHIADLVEAHLKAGEIAIAVIGDFNDYADSPTLDRLVESGQLENVLRRLPSNDQFTFNFGGAAQLIDGVLLSAELAQANTQVHILHLNADYPDSYQLDLSPEIVSLKSTDHDPAIVVFDWEQKGARLQQVGKRLEGVEQGSENSSQNVATIQAGDESAFTAKWLIYLIPGVALLLSGLVVFIVGRRQHHSS